MLSRMKTYGPHVPEGYMEHRARQMTPARKLGLLETFWTYKTETARQFLVLPDGRADMIARFRFDRWGKCWDIVPIITGPTSIASVVEIEANSGFLGARLLPGHLTSLGSSNHLRGARLVGRVAYSACGSLNRLPQTADTTAQLDAAFTLILSGISAQHPIRAPDAVEWALDELHLSGGRARLAGLAKRVGVQDRQLRRLFARHVGLDPKSYASVLRFQRALRLMRRGLSVTHSAVEAGYADQAHMTREFRKHGGFTPARLPEFELGWMPGPMA